VSYACHPSYARSINRMTMIQDGIGIKRDTISKITKERGREREMKEGREGRRKSKYNLQARLNGYITNTPYTQPSENGDCLNKCRIFTKTDHKH
jgi:hypothetical protein